MILWCPLLLLTVIELNTHFHAVLTNFDCMFCFVSTLDLDGAAESVISASYCHV